MSTTGPTEPTDYARLTDADLIHRLCAGQDGRAENELLARYAPRIECVVLGEVRRLHVPRSDWDDALQVGRFDLRTAAASYAAAGTSPDTGPSFEGLLTCVVTADTRDMGRHLRRDARHYGRPGHAPGEPIRPPPSRSPSGSTPPCWRSATSSWSGSTRSWTGSVRTPARWSSGASPASRGTRRPRPWG
jgi:hypothetical protein